MAIRDDIDRAIEARRKRNQEIIDKYKRVQEAEQRRSATNWYDDALSGAGMGAMMGGGPGAAIGGGLGALLGMARAIGQRQSEGQGFLKALGRTVFDFAPLKDPNTYTAAMRSVPGFGMMAFGSGGSQQPHIGSQMPRDTSGMPGLSGGSIQTGVPQGFSAYEAGTPAPIPPPELAYGSPMAPSAEGLSFGTPALSIEQPITAVGTNPSQPVLPPPEELQVPSEYLPVTGGTLSHRDALRRFPAFGGY